MKFYNTILTEHILCIKCCIHNIYSDKYNCDCDMPGRYRRWDSKV